jgi:hypothetical protein
MTNEQESELDGLFGVVWMKGRWHSSLKKKKKKKKTQILMKV